MERSLDSLAGMAKSAFGAGTSAAMRQATSPKTILEYIINFFTCGGIRRRNETQYQELIETMAETLKSTMPDRGAPLPENIILDDMDGCRVEFNLPGENNEAGQVIVRVSKGDHSETREIPLASFEKICRALLFRCEFSLPQDSVILTAQGGMNLKGAVLTGANLTSENLCDADLSGANLSGTSLGDSNFKNACLEDSIMCGATLDHANLTGANLQHASLLGCSMIECNCSGANMDHTNLSGATLIRADMSGATLQGATIMAAIMEGAVLTRANLRKASFISTNLDGADLAEANLNNTCFKDCTLTDLRTEDATMSTSTQTLFNEFYSENI
ncbi:SPI-2 type III secretion system effector PipB2 [Salmonella enterica]|nr:SPI-2 type III secretion system effector PipB2 [Salmonella enterica subsp. enterica serovar Typhimurium]EDN2465382.1 SPI-2 type III secretion system effector PipB2 [Salmonella enterica]EDR4229773.1 SPI-2 type III secretion system effector PipB2 [Salmonella enterica subsp. enterica serovar Typhimurium]EDZ4911622.1 SPI-2 type III secretion system effector PipB2 [Salmonella enterica subsp. enterica serovar Typhimurium]EEF7024519.1 SPI-2 type III secretion system effector PipB2 [Salmonella enter